MKSGGTYNCFKTHVMTSFSGSIWPVGIVKNPWATEHLATLGKMLQAQFKSPVLIKCPVLFPTVCCLCP